MGRSHKVIHYNGVHEHGRSPVSGLGRRIGDNGETGNEMAKRMETAEKYCKTPGGRCRPVN